MGYIQGKIVSGSNGSYIKEHLNAVHLCNNNAQTEGCFSQIATEGDWERTEPGVVLHNGATIAGLNDNVSNRNGILIDWNGADPPNQAGQDQMFLEFCYATGCPNGQRSGTLHSSPTCADSEALFREIFSHD